MTTGCITGNQLYTSPCSNIIIIIIIRAIIYPSSSFTSAWLGLWLQGNVVLQDAEAVLLATDWGYGAKCRQEVDFPDFQHDQFRKASPNPVATSVATTSTTATAAAAAAAAVGSTETGAIQQDRCKSKSTERTLSASLTLSDEEAAYLVLQASMEVFFPDGRLCTLAELWHAFRQKNEKFVANFKVYHFYRSQGYYIRSGIHYGVDFSVYRDLPTKCHSEMCVVVVSDGSIDMDIDITRNRDMGKGMNMDIDINVAVTSALGAEHMPAATTAAATATSQDTHTRPNPCPSPCPEVSWRSLTALTRVIPDVMKLLVICYVVRDHELLSSLSTELTQYSPEYLRQWVVRPATAISRRTNNRSEEFATIGNIQRKYQQQSKLVVTRKNNQIQTKKKRR
jgi:tRNA-intron lyase